MTGRLRGLYVITDPALTPAGTLVERVTRAIDGGARVVQYRDKGGDRERRRTEAAALVGLCRERGVPLVINDDVALAAAVGADGVHLGRDDADPGSARSRLGDDALIGVSCYDDLAAAETAEAAGAGYVAFGSFFPSTTKHNPARPGPALLTEARRRLSVPVAAIGGITPENGAALVAAGADMLAVVSGVFAASDPEAAARRYAALFDPG